ncbi:hypothetical protein N7481_013347, partial [Penicillium waksmanii]|uniref:uncharacterized protein n=1 Tax=Penicillium waksmanii TaxID=69791 RepID=UPI00254823B3
LASGILTLATIVFQYIISLYKTVDSFRLYPKRMYDLLNKLEALSVVLAPLINLYLLAAALKEIRDYKSLIQNTKEDLEA